MLIASNSETSYNDNVVVIDSFVFRIDSWMKSSKKSMYKSDETTNCLLQQMVTNNRTLETLVNQQRYVDVTHDLTGDVFNLLFMPKH
jgi:hypothetical protein